jgi:hypothetical protein
VATSADGHIQPGIRKVVSLKSMSFRVSEATSGDVSWLLLALVLDNGDLDEP